jgi:tetratricopeptide (TPR) repeat protein
MSKKYTRRLKVGESMLSGEGKDGIQTIYERARALSNIPDENVHIVELLSVYVKFESQHGFAWFLFGDALRSVGRLKEAEEALLKAVDLAPKENRFLVYMRIGMLMTKRGSPSDAEKWYRVATSEAGCPGWMWCLRGENLLRTEAYGLAKTCLEAALISEDVVKEEVFLNLALMERAQRLYAEARKHLHDALAIDPNYDEAKRVLQSLVGIEDTIKVAALAAGETTGAQTRD